MNNNRSSNLQSCRASLSPKISRLLMNSGLHSRAVRHNAGVPQEEDGRQDPHPGQFESTLADE